MITAQLLLMGFVAHWLSMQYHERQRLLIKDIDFAWTTSQQQMVDSMLLKNYILPAMDSLDKFDFKVEFNTDSMRNMIHSDNSKMVTAGLPPTAIPANKSKIIVQVSDSGDPNRFSRTRSRTIKTRDLVLQGVKLFVNKHSDSIGQTADISEIWANEPDTIFLKSAFYSHLRTIDPSIRVAWNTRDITDSARPNLVINNSILVGN